MRRLLIAVVAVGMVLGTGVSFAQEKDLSPIPKNVQRVLSKYIGSWTVSTEGETIGTVVYSWGPGQRYVIMEGKPTTRDGSSHYSGLLSWDGISENGTIMQGVTEMGHWVNRMTIVSKSVLEGPYSGVWQGKKTASKFRIEHQGSDQVTLSWTEQTSAGEKQPDYTIVYTRVKPTSDEQELIELYRVWLNATLKNEAVIIDRLLTDDFICGYPNGDIGTKALYLADITSDDYQATSIKDDDLKVRINGDMAVVTCIWTEKSQFKGTDMSGQYCSTDTWIKRDGRWQCMAEHISKVADTASDSKNEIAVQPSPELKKLEGLVGDWTYEGEQSNSPVAGLPYGGAGKYFGTITNRFVLDGSFLEEKIEDNNPSGRTSIVSLTGYDALAGKYTSNAFISDGSSSVATATLDGRTLTFDSTMTTSEGTKVLLRSVQKYSSDWSSYVSTQEASPDNGKTWKLWWKEEGRKVGVDGTASSITRADEGEREDRESYAQEESSQMPEKVRAFLDNMTGTWTIDQDDIEGTSHYEWASQHSALVGGGQVQGEDIAGTISDLWHWDGVSEDGVVANWGGMIGDKAAYGQIRAKVLSETSMQGQVIGLLFGSRMSGDVHVEFQGQNQYTWRRTNTVFDGEPKPDMDFKDVYTRVKPTTREDFEEFCKLYQGRWIINSTWDEDVPGLGKKGDQRTEYVHFTVTADGNAMCVKHYTGNETWTVLYYFDAANNQIKSVGVHSGGLAGEAITYRDGDKWRAEFSGSLANGTKAVATFTDTFSNDGQTTTTEGYVVIGGVRIEFPKTASHRVGN